MLSYQANAKVSAKQFIDLLNQTTLGARRPLDDIDVVQAMLDHADLMITAWDDTRLVGVARCVTDYVYCCYLSDLAVDEEYQHQGIGKALIATVEQHLQPTCKIILLAAPQAVEYYGKIGFEQHPSAWTKTPSKPTA